MPVYQETNEMFALLDDHPELRSRHTVHQQHLAATRKHGELLTAEVEQVRKPQSGILVDL